LGLNDVAMQNSLDRKLDIIRANTGIDLLEIRWKILHGKSVYMSAKKLKSITHILDDDLIENTYIFKGIEYLIEPLNTDVVCLYRV
jgi:hypothetical protein